ncbi:putative monooxygenase [Wickerhamomyces ciferrii]|uniref:Monooxygenase n=1 Tax=Wickerhamomyces ciferrii (strain ATCC 14091 / BCRC 22168 / CBS 111 / JCM 3599 / NBRC 0793 / NRRL Y-1031 F-60-10) TaxID=1206466 RepID=K0KVV4_WICCF|nr:putative monooxygenase [Wickerhamomyces ciferrii]CCH46097.1 putative monooxygenase [Wickerhamomyces ciferrii]
MTEPVGKKQKINPKKKLVINFFENNSPGLQYRMSTLISKTKIAERGKIHAIFVADSLAYFDSYKGPHNFKESLKTGIQAPKNDPSLSISAMAAVTKNVGFAVTFSSISEQPYHLARRLATLDHLTNGRIGWNVVSSFLPSTARELLNNAPLPEHDERYNKTEEYLQVIYELLLSSWRDDAVIVDREKGEYIDTDRVREINFKGDYFDVAGPSLSEPSKQRLPVIVQAGTSTKGKNFAAQHAEVIYINGLTPGNLGDKIKSIKKLAVEKGRNEDSIKFLCSATVIVGQTEEEAQAKYDELVEYSDHDGAQVLFGGWTGIDLSQWDDDQELNHVENNGMRSYIENLTKFNPGKKFTKKTIIERISVGGSTSAVFVGTPDKIANDIEKYVEESDVDGFNFTYAVWPESFEDLVDYVIPKLQEKGLAQTEYPVENGTYREQLYGKEGQSFVPENHPAFNLRWRSGVSEEEFVTKLNKK